MAAMPLVFESADGLQRLELEVVGHESLDVGDEQYDSNWLLVRMDARDGETPGRPGPALLMGAERRPLARASRPRRSSTPAASRAQSDPAPIRCPRATARLRVYFEMELVAWRHSSVVGRRDVFLEFALSPDALHAAALEPARPAPALPAAGRCQEDARDPLGVGDRWRPEVSGRARFC
jgi:hypothetical protein